MVRLFLMARMKKDKRQQAKKKQLSGKKKAPTQRQPMKDKALPKHQRQTAKLGRLWLFRFASIIVIPVLVLFSLEFGLRLSGYGASGGFTVRETVDSKKKILSNPRFTWRFFEPQLAQEVGHFTLPLEKPKTAYRIFVLGASAAQGAPAPGYGIARMLEAMLQDQYPGVGFEVVNAAITATNSHVVLPVIRDCRRLESDLFILYLGNNEVVGPYGAGTIFTPLASNLSLIRAGIALKATRLGQLIADALKKLQGRSQAQPGKWGGMAMFLEHRVRSDDPAMTTVYRHFEKNLLDICRVAQESDIPLILSTVGVNLKDSPPFASLHHPGLSEEDIRIWETMVREGEALRKQGILDAAAGRFLNAERIDPDYAALQFRLGRCYWEMGAFAKAKERYKKALELDALRFRADTQINAIIRRVASGKDKQGVYFVDAAHLLEANSPKHTPGQELFYEHVHLNFRGNYIVTRLIFEKIRSLLPAWITRHTSGNAILTEAACAQRLAYTGWNQYMIAKGLLRQMQEPPFSDQLYNDEYVKRLSAQVRSLADKYTSAEGHREVLEQYQLALDKYDVHWSLHDYYAEFLYEGLSNPQEAEKHLIETLKHCPQSAEQRFLLAKMLSFQGRYSESEKYFRKALMYNPQSTRILHSFGITLLQQGKHHQAARQLAEAVRIDPANAMAHSNLGVALAQADENQSGQQALRHLKEAIAIDPDLIPARNNLANYFSNRAMKLAMRGDTTQARAFLQQGVDMLPDAANLRYSLAVLLDRGGSRQAATAQVYEILRIDPDHKQARQLLRHLKMTDRSRQP